jgi:ABC-type Fe3+-hydroxamate transport system substrate-binding protein
MADIGEVLGLLAQAQGSTEQGQNLVTTAKEKLEEIAQQLANLGVQDRAAITQTAAQSTEQAMGALTQAAQAVQNATAATQQASGTG